MPSETSQRDDGVLLSLCREGDARAWEELIRRYRRLIYSIPFACGLGADAADDVFQRVALLLVENIANLRDPKALPAWLITTGRRECWATKRKSSRSRAFEEGEVEAIPEDPPDVIEALHRIGQEHAVQVAFSRLAGPCRDLLHALYVEDPTPAYDELAERLGRPIGSLGPTRARCLEKLRRLYEAP